MRILLDECLPRRLKHSIAGHDVATVQERGWSSKKNGELLRLMEGTVDVFLTSDQNLRNQHNLIFAALTETYGQLRAMGETARRCLVRLRELWPPEVHTMPLYPAFQPAT